MIENNIQINKPFISITYDMVNNRLIGDTEFEVLLFDNNEPDNDLTVTIEHDENLIVTPSSFQGNSSRPKVVTVELAEGTIIEEGSYNFTLNITNPYATEQKVIPTIVATENYVNDPDTAVYKLKYFIQRDNYRLNIYQFVDLIDIVTPIEVNGMVDKSYQDKKDLVDPIISSTLKIRLEASLDLTFEDLYSEDEKTFKVELIKDDNIEFLGYLLPDGIWEDFVADKWILDVTASDGLSTLKNVSFSQSTLNNDGSTVNFFGRMSAVYIINTCLGKMGLNLPLICSCQVMYNDMLPSAYSNVFYNIYLSVERYFQNDKDPMDCESVLKSILQVFNCTIHQRDGRWVIYRSIDLEQSNVFWKSSFGNFNEPEIITLGQTLGSQINDFPIFHCNENQKKSIDPSVQAYKVSYEYGDSKNILANGGLILEGTGFDIPGWQVHNTGDGSVGRGVRNGYSYGIRHAVRPFDPQYPLLLSLNQSIDIKANSNIKFRIKFRNTGINSLYLNFRFGVTSPSNTVYFKINEGFGADTSIQAVRNAIPYGNIGNNVNQGAGDAIFEGEAMAPIDGKIFVEIFKETGGQQGGLFGVYSVEVSAGSTGNIKSKDYTGRRLGRTSTNVKSNVTVYNGDSGSDLFVGTIYKKDSDTPTDLWTRYDYDADGNLISNNDNSEVLELNAEDNLRISPKPMMLFEGDFKGYMKYMNVISIDSIPFKKFQFIKWSYSYDNDVTKMLLKEFSSNILADDQFKVDIYENYGNEAKVTLVS